MARRLELGAVSTPTYDPQLRDPATGKWFGKVRRVKNPETGEMETIASPGRPERYRARCYFRAQDGIVREITRYGSSKTEAKSAIEQAIAEREHRTSDARVKPFTPFVRAGEVWLEAIRRTDSGLSKRSIEDYAATFSRYVASSGSSLRGLSLAQAADRQRLRKFLQGVAETYGDGAAHMTRSVLSGIFRMAERDGVLPANPILGLGVVKAQTPKETARDKNRAMTRGERDHLLDVAYRWAAGEDIGAEGESATVPQTKPLNPRSVRRRRATADLASLLAGTGARITEARLLRWENVNLKTGVIHIDGTKSATANRVVNAPAWLLKRLKARASEMDTKGKPVGYVIASPALLEQHEVPWEQSNASSAIRDLLDAVGLEWATPHTFRRTSISLMHDAGVPLAQIAGWHGHTRIEQTMAYIGREHDTDKAHLAAVL